jgi:hypothetical protein
MPDVTHYTSALNYSTLTIAASGTESGSLDLYGTTLVGLYMPAAWSVADLSFKASSDNTTFYDVYRDSGSSASITTAASRYVALDPADFAGVRFLKLVSSATQSASRVITVVSRPL